MSFIKQSCPLCYAFSVLNRPTQTVTRNSPPCKLKVAFFSYYSNEFLPFLGEFLVFFTEEKESSHES